jgi:hypothetical protein
VEVDTLSRFVGRKEATYLVKVLGVELDHVGRGDEGGKTQEGSWDLEREPHDEMGRV